MIGVMILTLRELRARKIVLGLFIVATLVWGMLAFALQLQVVDGALEGIRIFGQAPEAEVTPDGQPAFGGDALRMFVVGAEAFVAGAAYWIGILLALFATGGLVASLMERGQVDLLLSKPLGRARILGGRLLGVGVATALLAVYLLGAVWLVMSLKTGIWNPRFLLAIGVVFAMFAVIYGVVTLLSVWTESAPLAFIVTLGVIFVSLVVAIPGLAPRLDPPWRQLVEGLHAVLPRFPAVGGSMIPRLARGEEMASWSPLASSLAFGLATYLGAFLVFRRKDF